MKNDNLKSEIADGIRKLEGFKLDRTEINAEMKAIREALEARGIPKKALAMAMTYLSLDPEKREGFDVAYALVREAGGLPLQDDLFSAAERMANDAMPEEPEKKAEPDASAIDKIFRSEDAAKTKGKKVHDPAGPHQGAIN